MPSKPSRWCGRCKQVHSDVCPRDKLSNKKTESFGQGRGGRPWRRLREQVFERDNYLCQEHYRQGRLVAVDLHGVNAGICDHMIPKAEGGTDDIGNLETLCKCCSDAKSREEARRGVQKFRD